MRIVTRADLDGIVCAVLLHKVVDVEDYRFTEAYPLQQGDIEIKTGDIITNLPYREGCSLWFDHHFSSKQAEPKPGAWALAPSAARVVYDYYGADKFPGMDNMVVETDVVDSASLTAEQIAEPSSFFLIELTVNPKAPQDEPYWRDIIRKLLDSNGDANAVLGTGEGKLRSEVVLREIHDYRDLLEKHSRMQNRVVITDLRGIPKLPAENRFLIYGMFPQAEVSVKLAEVRNEKGHLVKISLGRSIVNTESTANLGDILASHGGGGHAAAGSVHVPYGEEERVLADLLNQIGG